MQILKYIWQLPQNILGLLFLLFIKTKIKSVYKDIVYYHCPEFKGGISLGNYIILGYENSYSIKHEYGHQRQSLYLGPLYLIIVGIPSLLHAWVSDYIKCCDRHKEGYYHYWTEKWADKLGGNI